MPVSASSNPISMPVPLVNGYRWSYSAITFLVSGAPVLLQSIDYWQEVKATPVYGNGARHILGYAAGQIKAGCSFDILAEEYENLILALCQINLTPGSGFMDVPFDLKVAKQDGTGMNAGPMFTDVLRGTKLDKVSKGYKLGDGGLVNKCECSLLYIEQNGQLPIGTAPTAVPAPTGGSVNADNGPDYFKLYGGREGVG
jgi:hypothetical protein